MVEQKRRKILFKEISIIHLENGYGISLDGTPLKTPSSAVLYANSLPLIEAVMEEFKTQKKNIDFKNMPLFRLLATSIDRVAPNRGEINRITLSFGATDLLCYRAKEPDELIKRQEFSWQPLIKWAEEKLGVEFYITDSLLPVKQPKETINAMENVLQEFSDIKITSVSSIAAATGSLIIAFALEGGIISSKLAFEISHLEQNYQIERWGEDEVLTDKFESVKKDIYQAYKLLELV